MMSIDREYHTRSGLVFDVVEARPEDAIELIGYLERTCGESDFFSFGPGELDLSVEEECHSLEGYNSSRSRLFLLARISGDIVGTLSFDAESMPRLSHSGDLAMSVSQSCWNSGIGSTLVDEALRWCRSRGIKKINLRVRTDNVRAIRLYEKRGFLIEGTITNDMLIGGRYFDHYLMGLFLD